MSDEPGTARRQRRVLAPVVLLVGLATVVLLVIGLVVRGAGPVPAALGSFFAFVPVVPAVAVFLWIDRWEPEPGRLVLAAILWGAGVAAVASTVTSFAVDKAWEQSVGPEASEFVGTVLTAPVVEEFFKGLFLLILLCFRRREFDGLVDGIVYGGLVGVGFAFTENIFYLGTAFADDGLGGGIHLFILRCVLSPFAHPIFTAVAGLAVGIAARSVNPLVTATFPGLGYLGAVFLHALWNGSAMLVSGVFWFVYALVMLPMLGLMTWLVMWARRREQRIVATQLPQLVAAGWVDPAEVRPLASLTGRRDWRTTVAQHFGREAARAIDGYHTSVTELAFLLDRSTRTSAGSDPAALRDWQEHLVNRMLSARTRARRFSEALAAAERR